MILTCKIDPDAELRCMQDFLEYRFSHKERNIKSVSRKEPADLVKNRSQYWKCYKLGKLISNKHY